MRIRDDACGACSGVGAGGVAVSLMVGLMSDYLALPEGVSLSSCRHGNEVRVWGYAEALAAIRLVVAKAGDDPSEVALRSMRIGAATTTLAAGGEVLQRVTLKEGRWRCSRVSQGIHSL